MSLKVLEDSLNDKVKARRLLKENADTEGRIFRQAAEEGNLRIVNFFLTVKPRSKLYFNVKRRCSNKGAEDEDGTTPLHLAASNGHTAVVQRLISSGADVNTLNKKKETPLYMASQEGCANVVNILIHHNADPHLCSLNEEKTAIDIAIARGHCAVIECLLSVVKWAELEKYFHKFAMEIGIDPDIVDLECATMLHHVKDIGLIHYLLQCNVLVDARDDEGCTPLYWACFYGRNDIAKLLIKHGASVNTKNFGDETPLIACVEGRAIEVAKTLLENDAEVNLKCGDDDETALHFAIGERQEELVKLFLLWNADVNMQDRYGCTPLHKAAKLCSLRFSQLLIECGANVNAQNSAGETPLHYAPTGEIIELLLWNGASATILDDLGMKPLQGLREYAFVEEDLSSV